MCIEICLNFYVIIVLPWVLQSHYYQVLSDESTYLLTDIDLHTHTYIHTYIHAYIHTFIYVHFSHGMLRCMNIKLRRNIHCHFPGSSLEPCPLTFHKPILLFFYSIIESHNWKVHRIFPSTKKIRDWYFARPCGLGEISAALFEF